jgi:2-polyprenyl-6-methoxyphenol hydroxylase-like FAD-dependent oxidoreductase
VTHFRAFDLAILGSGPTALLAALAASKYTRPALVQYRARKADSPFRIDAVPSRTLALLVEFGVNPRTLGVDALHEYKGESWATALPQWSRATQTAHVERPMLELALFDAVRAESRITIIADRARAETAQTLCGADGRAGHLIDATGRSAVTSQMRWKAPHPWGSRFFWTSRLKTPARPEFRVAALPNGYAYRIGSAERIGIGLVGNGDLLKTKRSDMGQMLCNYDARWLCEGMPSLELMKRGASGISSIQWAVGGSAALAGDASLARDALSSQGLAASLSDALYAVAAVRSDDLHGLRQRQASNLRTHLRILSELLMRCRFRESSLWLSYGKFIDSSSGIVRNAENPVLRDGRLVESR